MKTQEQWWSLVALQWDNICKVLEKFTTTENLDKAVKAWESKDWNRLCECLYLLLEKVNDKSLIDVFILDSIALLLGGTTPFELAELSDDDLITEIQFIRSAGSLLRQRRTKMDTLLDYYKSDSSIHLKIKSEIRDEKYESFGYDLYCVLPMHDKMIEEANRRNLLIGLHVPVNIKTEKDWWGLLFLQWKRIYKIIAMFLSEEAVQQAEMYKKQGNWRNLYSLLEKARIKAPKVSGTYCLDGWQDLCDLCSEIWVFEK